jgi:hypothetical protein
MPAAEQIVGADRGPAPVRAERVTLATIVLCLVFALVAVVWTREAELIAFACQITESVPPMTSLGALILFVMLSLLARQVALRLSSSRPGLATLSRRLSLSGAQLMYLYAFTTIATIVFSVGVMRTVLPEMTTLSYYADPGNEFAEAEPYVNRVLHVTDPEAARQYYEGFDRPPAVPDTGDVPVLSSLLRALVRPVVETAAVPWRYWWVPLAAWSLLMLVLFATMQCLAGLVEREWTLAERLPYPLVEIPLGITEQRSFVSGVRFLSDYVMWIGFIIGAGYGLHEMIASTTFAFPLWGREYPLGRLLTEHPWSVVGGGINIFIMPEAYGLAYFASQEVLISTAATWLGYCFFRVLMAAMGRQVAGSRYQDVSLGSFLGFVGAALWVARRPLGQAFRMAFGIPGSEHAELPRAHLWMARGATVGTLFLCAFLYWMGLPVRYVLYFVAVFLISAIGHARVRAMAGSATPWLFPHSGMTYSYVRLFGSAGIGRPGDYRPFAAAFHLRWLDRGYPHSALAGQLESYNMARRADMDMRDMTKTLLLAIPVGLIVGWWMHLTVFYNEGGNVLGGATTTGGVRERYAMQDATWGVGLVNAPTGVDAGSWTALAVGLLITLGSVVLRNLFLRFPLHPAGFVIGMNHGQRFWAPFAIVWLIKGLLLHVGGVGTYRRLMPLFLGIVIGHFFFTGIIIGLAKTTGLPLFEHLPIIWF